MRMPSESLRDCGSRPVGRETARLLAEEGHSVILTSRNAGSLNAGDVRTVSSDATDAAQLAVLSKGADAIFMCAMAAYHRWPTDFFPIMDGTVKAAEQVGARLLVAGNVYGYGAAAVSPLTPDLEPDPTSRKGTTRHIMWQRALRSSVPAIEVRASDYLGEGAVAYFSLLALPSLLRNEPVPSSAIRMPRMPGLSPRTRRRRWLQRRASLENGAAPFTCRRSRRRCANWYGDSQPR